MVWILRSPQIHSTFSNLGVSHPDGYRISENCNSALESILHNILVEDKYLRSYRRNISCGQNLNKDLIPLLIHAKNDKTIELLIRILVNLTIPIECLLSVDVISKTDFGRHTVFELNNLLTSIKLAFTDNRVTKVVLDFLKNNFDVEQTGKLTPEQCTNISNSLLLLRNILHIPEESTPANPNHNGPGHVVQNQILWNIFSQSVDKVLIKLITVPEAANWGVTMVQLIALLYKDQHVVTLHKLLNLWLETSISESSEDNESNTYSPDRGSHDSSPMLTSDPTSDSSDNGTSGKCNPGSNVWPAPDGANVGDGAVVAEGASDASGVDIAEEADVADGADSDDSGDAADVANDSESGEPAAAADTSRHLLKPDDGMSTTCSSISCGGGDEGAGGAPSGPPSQNRPRNKEENTGQCETSDCGYGTQLENQGSISTSSNEDDVPAKKPVHQKPHNPKQRPAKARQNTNTTPQDNKRRKIVKRAKANIINVQGLSHKTPTDDDISNILKEFTVDFLLKGYNSLVQTLHTQILTNLQLEIDTSHFFWLVTYFLKFATQIELDLEHICSVLSFDIVSYLTAEGVNLCEQFELAVKLDGNDLKPNIRRLHLVVTAIREFVQAIEVYKKIGHIRSEDMAQLVRLQTQMCELRELRDLLLLLLRHYNPALHSKQYLEDLIVTNHILLLFVDNGLRMPEYTSPNDMHEHLMQFATPDIMHQYGILLEDYAENGEFVNDCIFTVMHHVGGELGGLIALFQPKILKTFTSIWETEFEICDDWSDLIEYVINTFIKKPHALQVQRNFRLKTESFEGDDAPAAAKLDKWTEEELSTLNWNYMQCNTSADVIGDIVNLFKEDGLTKPRHSVIKELYRQNIIDKEDYDKLMTMKSNKIPKPCPMSKEARDGEIGKLCEQLIQDGKIKSIEWIQKVLLEICFVKFYIDKETLNASEIKTKDVDDHKIMQFELFKKKPAAVPNMSQVAYHCLMLNNSVPLVPWNTEQAAVIKDLKFLQLLHRLGFSMPVDTGKVFIRTPYFWTPRMLYDIAAKILPIDTSKLKFTLSDISSPSYEAGPEPAGPAVLTLPPPSLDNFYQVQKRTHIATMVNFTPMPGTSFTCEERVTVESHQPNWLQVVQRSQEMKITLIPRDEAAAAPLESDDNISVCDTASVASNLTRMYVSDEDEKPDVLMPIVVVPPCSPVPEVEPEVEPKVEPKVEPELELAPKPQPEVEPEPLHTGGRAGKRARVHFSPTRSKV